MPIAGLTQKRRMPRVGKIHLGYKDPDRGFPVRTDYFVFPTDHPQYAELVNKYGEEPRELPILIPVDDEEKWCSQYYRAYSKSRGLVCKGDGISAVRMVAKGTDSIVWADCTQIEMKTVQCPGRDCPFYAQKKCGEIMNLQFLLPDVPGLGVWQIDTGSVNSIININSAADLIKGIYRRIAMIPLLLTLEPKEVNNPENGKKQTIYTLNLRVNMCLNELAEVTRKQGQVFELEMPVSDDETPDYAQEFDALPPAPVSVSPPQPVQPPQPPPASSATKPEKKASRFSRPTKAEVAAAPPLTDEDFDQPKEVDKSGNKEATKPVKYKPVDEIETFGDLYDACLKQWPSSFKSRNDILKEAGASSQADLTDTPKDIYARIMAVRIMPEGITQ